MADAIRVNCDGKWTYAPAGGVVQSRLERLAKAGMASFSNGTAQLRSDAGPLLWDLINRNEPLRHDCKTAALRALGKNCINLTPNEKLVFGKREGCSYDEFSDLSLAKGEPDIGIKVGITPLKDKQIVMTAWPSSGTLIPARVQIAGRTIWLRLVEPQDEGQRCFVLDDKCGSLLTVSQKTDGGDAGLEVLSGMDAGGRALGGKEAHRPSPGLRMKLLETTVTGLAGVVAICGRFEPGAFGVLAGGCDGLATGLTPAPRSALAKAGNS